MTGVKLPPDLQAYTDALRAYHLRLAEWLGLDPNVVMSIKDVDAGNEFGAVRVDIQWRTFNERQTVEASRGRVPMPPQLEGDGEGVTFTDGVHLDWEQTECLRVEVGERPEMFTPEQRLMLDGLRWREAQER